MGMFSLELYLGKEEITSDFELKPTAVFFQGEEHGYADALLVRGIVSWIFSKFPQADVFYVNNPDSEFRASHEGDEEEINEY